MGSHIDEGMIIMDLIHKDEFGSYHQMVKGKVCGYGRDRTKMTLQVKLAYMEEGQNILENVWWVVPYQGVDYGIFFRPEIGDEVLIIFLGDHNRNAIAFGTLPSNESTLWEEVTDKNEKKSIRSKGGNEITFWDEPDKNRLEIKNKKLCMSMSEESEEVTLADMEKENELKLSKKNGDIQITAKEKIVFTCGEASFELAKDGSITLKGKSIKIDGQDIVILAIEEFTGKASKIVLEAKVEANLKAKTKVTLGANGNTVITGGSINIG